MPGVLLRNAQQQFVCKNIYLKPEDPSQEIILKVPIAHGEGRFYAANAEMEAINNNNQVIYRYVDPGGMITPESNPNGAMENIAGICNIEKNVFGMMPHPERACSASLGNLDGRAIFKSLFGIVVNN